LPTVGGCHTAPSNAFKVITLVYRKSGQFDVGVNTIAVTRTAAHRLRTLDAG
jgi:hypothetical protein